MSKSISPSGSSANLLCSMGKAIRETSRDPHSRPFSSRMSAQQALDPDTTKLYGATAEPAPDVLLEVTIPNNIWAIIGSLWLGTFLSSADATIVSTTANTIASSMGASGKLTWIATSYLITNTIFQPLVGRFSDVYGRKTILIVAQFWFALGCVCCALARNVTEFAVARAIAGIGGGGMSALSSIITTDVIPLRMRGVYQGYSNLMYAVGQFSGPVIGSLFLAADHKAGWRWMFAVQVPCVALAAFLVHRNVHDYRKDQEHIKFRDRFTFENMRKIDLPGSFLLSGVIVSVLMLFGSSTRFEITLWVSVLFVSAAGFYLVEKYVMTVHVIPPDAFQGVLRLTAFIVFFAAASIYALNYMLPLYCQIVLGFTQIQLGIFNTFVVFASGGGSLLAGWLLTHEDKVHPDVVVQKAIKLTVYCCVFLFAGACLCLAGVTQTKPAFANTDVNLIGVCIVLLGNVVAGVAYGAFLVVLLILVVGKVGIKHQAAVTGMNYMFRSMGQASGVGTTLSFYDHILSGELEGYLLGHSKRPDGAAVLEKLKASTFYIRNGLPTQYVKKVLKIYRGSVADTLILVFIMTSISICLSLLLSLYPVGRRPSLA